KIGNRHQLAILLARLMELRQDDPIIRIHQKREAHRTDDHGDDPALGEQQHDIKEQRLGDQRSWPNEVDGIVSPAPEVDVAVEPSRVRSYTDCTLTTQRAPGGDRQELSNA